MRSPLVGFATAALVLAGCGFLSGEPPPPPTDAQAREHLAKVVAVVASGDLSTLCELGSGTCEMELRTINEARIPAAPPIVVGTASIQPTQQSSGGYLLALCGLDGEGTPYRSEMLVFEDHRGMLISINTIYWLGAGVALDPVTDPLPPDDLPPGCS